MKNLMLKCLILLSLVSFSAMSEGQNTEAKLIKIINPPQNHGVQIGDVLHRTVEIEVQESYKLSKSILPIKGRNLDGIELKDIQAKLSHSSGKNKYLINLTYQVFVSASKPALIQLPKEHLTFTADKSNFIVEVPRWQFWYAALVPEGILNAKPVMQPQHKADLQNVVSHQVKLGLAMALLAIGVLGLLYMNADGRWIPWMNGAFAQAHRKLKKLPKTLEGQKQASVFMHQAFNQTYGSNLFDYEVDKFLLSHPQFSKFKNQIRDFFDQSNAFLFANHSTDSSQYMSELLKLSKHLRDCERGA
ncbi:MAG: nonribosomal peptide synthetase MxaA [Methylotenera sp.]|uniref:nonribosomal peptide synthetase MxaA n=1 Tax=Methylotenera sp. TaxID=2051956 RepID=UPI00248A72BD|nr:nonribosomal peptide synthetase MxaA [Methylotenera sp.]MDI1310175.1 nonribosomal peptide synthetase MxaA [Methylotenera sp.]